ncbi:hypothetical protein LINPERPRIM_LOCUS41274 [Linum perenne]
MLRCLRVFLLKDFRLLHVQTGVLRTDMPGVVGHCASSWSDSEGVVGEGIVRPSSGWSTTRLLPSMHECSLGFTWAPYTI